MYKAVLINYEHFLYYRRGEGSFRPAQTAPTALEESVNRWTFKFVIMGVGAGSVMLERKLRSML